MSEKNKRQRNVRGSKRSKDEQKTEEKEKNQNKTTEYRTLKKEHKSSLRSTVFS